LELPVKANDAAESDHNYFDRLCDRIPADSMLKQLTEDDAVVGFDHKRMKAPQSFCSIQKTL
jgi:hypothetical protein